MVNSREESSATAGADRGNSSNPLDCDIFKNTRVSGVLCARCLHPEFAVPPFFQPHSPRDEEQMLFPEIPELFTGMTRKTLACTKDTRTHAARVYTRPTRIPCTAYQKWVRTFRDDRIKHTQVLTLLSSAGPLFETAKPSRQCESPKNSPCCFRASRRAFLR